VVRFILQDSSHKLSGHLAGIVLGLHAGITGGSVRLCAADTPVARGARRRRRNVCWRSGRGRPGAGQPPRPGQVRCAGAL